ncbi:hypothetical protein V6N12_027262 [Hibiscus sabdariffa]|uniref:Uncharacterized protein n=1 Tax=Hibiscus sabdariffa TaxID=183260 RepID=A0ABR2DXI1_9ROSI
MVLPTENAFVPPLSSSTPHVTASPYDPSSSEELPEQLFSNKCITQHVKFNELFFPGASAKSPTVSRANALSRTLPVLSNPALVVPPSCTGNSPLSEHVAGSSSNVAPIAAPVVDNDGVVVSNVAPTAAPVVDNDGVFVSNVAPTAAPVVDNDGVVVSSADIDVASSPTPPVDATRSEFDDTTHNDVERDISEHTTTEHVEHNSRH